MTSPSSAAPSRATVEQHVRGAFSRYRPPVTSEQIREHAYLSGAAPRVLEILDVLREGEAFHWHQQVLARLAPHLHGSHR
jgi:hypothetical protein